MKASPPDTPEHHIRMAKIYIHEASKTVHRSWFFTLMAWAAERRLAAARLKKIGPAQKELFS